MKEAATSLNKNPMQALTLGQPVEYKEVYTPELLQAVPRQLNRDEINLTAVNLPFHGCDMWTGFELSWLNKKGKPCVAIMQCTVPATSPNLIESKSFKLYLNSFNQSHFESSEQVRSLLQNDLSNCAGVPVLVELTKPNSFDKLRIDTLPGICIDELDISIDSYEYSTDSLSTSEEIVSETITSDLLKSNCLITNQPDWGSVLIRYRGRQIDHAGLLKYLISFRRHNEFHEQCVERIFCDLNEYCQPEKLTVYARYTRRGGLDINPFRSNFEQPYDNIRLARQ